MLLAVSHENLASVALTNWSSSIFSYNKKFGKSQSRTCSHSTVSSGSPCLLLIHLGLLLHGTGIQSRLASANPDIAPRLWEKREKSKQLFLWAIIFFYLGKKTSQVPTMPLLAEVGHVVTPKIYENQFPCWVQSNHAIVCEKMLGILSFWVPHKLTYSSFYFLQLPHIQS